jgi:hypothetical protein
MLVLWRLPLAVLVRSLGANTVKKGKAGYPLGDATAPREWHQQHHTERAQAKAIDDMLFARPHRIAEEPFGPYLVRVAPFERFMRRNDQCYTSGQKGRHQHGQQDAAEKQAGPFGAIEHAMEVLELPLRTQAENAQDGGDGSLARGQNRSNGQQLGPEPGLAAKGMRKGRKDQYNVGRQARHRNAPFERGSRSVSLPCLPCFVQELTRPFLFCPANG